MKRKKPACPTLEEARTIKLIAIADGLMVTYVGGSPQYSTPTGDFIKTKLAERLIKNKWLVGDTGDSLFGDAPQRYRCRKP